MTNSLLEGLNREQLQTVTDNKGVLTVLAGAGSGKTKVLTSRIAHLIQNGAYPSKILAVTFTNKAAKEMRMRLEKILGEEVVKHIWVGTFHSICGRILRQDIESYRSEEGIKWEKNFAIYDEDESVAFIQNYLPQDLKGKFSNDDINYIVDLIYEYYESKGFLNDGADENASIDIDEEELIQFVVKNAQKDGVGKFEAEDITFIVQGELEYCDSLNMFD